MAQHISCTVDGFEAIHRYEDLPLIAEVLRAHKPFGIVEFGTAGGGFAVFLAKTLAEWNAQVVSIDKEQNALVTDRLWTKYPNLSCVSLDLLAQRPAQWLIKTLCKPGAALYTDNGNKMTEIKVYAPFLPVGGLLGTHDYGTEVDPAIIEPWLANWGFTPYRHDDFAALAHPEWYPVSLTRFWVRERLK